MSAERMATYPALLEPVDTAYIDSFQIPDGCFVQGIVSFVSYVDPDGVNRIAHHVASDLPLASTIGLLELGKLSIYDAHRAHLTDDG